MSLGEWPMYVAPSVSVRRRSGRGQCPRGASEEPNTRIITATGRGTRRPTGEHLSGQRILAGE